MPIASRVQGTVDLDWINIETPNQLIEIDQDKISNAPMGGMCLFIVDVEREKNPFISHE